MCPFIGPENTFGAAQTVSRTVHFLKNMQFHFGYLQAVLKKYLNIVFSFIERKGLVIIAFSKDQKKILTRECYVCNIDTVGIHL